jgi:SAM-dependent methyltransferase
MPTLRSVLSLPSAYRLFWNAIGGPEYLKTLMAEYVKPQPGCRILDIGCGPGTVLPYLPRAEYVGFDLSPQYVETARRRFPQGTYTCARVCEYTLLQRAYFDIVLALGIVHHLDDGEALQLFRIAHQALRPGGRLVTLDGVFISGQSATARYLVRHDRGQFMRTKASYVRLATQVFPTVNATIRHDLLRIPYTHIIMECVARPATPAAAGESR